MTKNELPDFSFNSKINSLFFVPLTEREAKVERSKVSGIYAHLARIKKSLFITEQKLKQDLKILETKNYLEFRKSYNVKDSEKLAITSPDYTTLLFKYNKVVAERQLIEDYMEALNKKDFAIDTIIKLEISDKKLYNSM